MTSMCHIMIVGQYIYWTDWQRRTIERVNKTGDKDTRRLIIEHLPDLMAIRTITMTADQTRMCAN